MEDTSIYSLIFIGIIFYMGYITGQAVTILRFRSIMRRIAESMGIDVEREIRIAEAESKEVSVLKVDKLETETHGDMIYLFDKERNDFICQAKTLDELAKLAKDIKKINKAVVQHNDKTFIFDDGKSEEYNFQ